MSDLINRADAIEAMWKALYAYEDLTEKQFMEHEELELKDWFQHRIFVQRMHEECMKAVESLPSAEAVQGEWTKVIDEETPNVTTWHYECSQCGAGRWEKGQLYCSNCGAIMLGGDTE